MAFNSSVDRVALLMHEGTQNVKGKTGLAFLRYGKAPVVSVIDYQNAGRSLSELTGIDCEAPIVKSLEEALVHEPNVLVIGIAPSGGKLPQSWMIEIEQAVTAGLNIVNGLHSPLAQLPEFRSLPRKNQWIWDVRQEPSGLSVGTGKAATLSCKRVLSVGTDMSVGKMSTNLELSKACNALGIRSKVIATGQTNLILGDDGVALDAVRVDYASGAVEREMMLYGPHYEILFVEGQGSLLNPSSTATLPLLRGGQPTHLVLVHKAGQTSIDKFPHIKIPKLAEVVDFYENIAFAMGSFVASRVVCVALNTVNLDEESAKVAIAKVEKETGLPCTDPIRFGSNKLLEPILNS